MTFETNYLSAADLRAYEAQAHFLRGEAMRNGGKAIAAFVANLFHRAVDAFSRSAHA